MNPILIDEEKCIKCLLCVNDCIRSYLYLENEKINTFGRCIECGHCYAICPQGAITLTNYECSDEKVVPMTQFDADTLLQAMKSRRSIRQFKNQNIEAEKISKIIEAGRYAPTGANAQNVAFTVLGEKQREIEGICINMFRDFQNDKSSQFHMFLQDMNISDNFFFKGAPSVIAVSSPSSINAGLASSYMEIMAETLGLGVLYCGYFVMCSHINDKLRNIMELNEGYEVQTCIVLGYPDVDYQRIVPRNEADAKVLK